MPRASIKALWTLLPLLTAACVSGVPLVDQGDGDAGLDDADPPKVTPPEPEPTPQEPEPTPSPEPEPAPPEPEPAPPEPEPTPPEPEPCPDLWYPDLDGDGDGDSAAAGVQSCEAPPDHVATRGDCDDANPAVSASAQEACDGVDNDCDGATDDDGACPCPVAIFEGRAYMICAATATWVEARDLCAATSQHLATVDDGAEDQWLLEQAQLASLGETWIGLNDLQDGGVFVWTDGSAPGYTHWNSGQPNNNGDQDCVEIHTQDDWAGTWNDEECGARQSFICERDPP